MLKKVKLILVLISLSVALCLMSNTYSRYVADTTGNINVAFAKWQIKVNSNDITTNNNSTITFEPTMLPNDNVASGTIAPASIGYFDIAIDPTNVDLSFSYTIDLVAANQDMPDLMITKYAVLPNNYDGTSELTYTNFTGTSITSNMMYNNSSFNTFTIRVYFEWYEGMNESMDDEADTLVGLSAVTNNTVFTITADISFEQII